MRRRVNQFAIINKYNRTLLCVDCVVKSHVFHRSWISTMTAMTAFSSTNVIFLFILFQIETFFFFVVRSKSTKKKAPRNMMASTLVRRLCC